MRGTLALGALIGFTLNSLGAPGPYTAEVPHTAPEQETATSSVRELLKSSSNRDVLEQAAATLARSRDPRDLILLGQLLHDGEFLARLDNVSNLETRHLSRVMAALGEHPILQTVDLCLRLADDPVYVANDDRKRFLLQVLAAVKPLSDRAALLFERTNAEGYFSFNAPLLAANGSPRALEIFESMMLDQNVAIEERIDTLHIAMVPRRTELPILRASSLLLSRASETSLVTGVIESVFDFQSSWFGIESKITEPAWQTASTDTLRFALHLADTALARHDLNAYLRQTVGRARQKIQRALSLKRLKVSGANS
jgi:hypothetical protein